LEHSTVFADTAGNDATVDPDEEGLALLSWTLFGLSLVNLEDFDDCSDLYNFVDDFDMGLL